MHLLGFLLIFAAAYHAANSVHPHFTPIIQHSVQFTYLFSFISNYGDTEDKENRVSDDIYNTVDPSKLNSELFRDQILSTLFKDAKVDSTGVDTDRTYRTLKNHLGRMINSYRNARRRGTAPRISLINQWRSRQYKFSIVFCRHVVAADQLQKKVIDNEEKLQKADDTIRKMGDQHLRSTECLKRSVARLQNLLSAKKGRAPSKIHAAGLKPYSTSQRRRQRANFVKEVRRSLDLLGVPDYDVVSVKYTDNAGNVRELKLKENRGTDTEQVESEDLNMIDTILCLKDHSLISDDAYHELSMVCKALPRSYKIRNRINELNSVFEMKPVNGFPGVQQSFSQTLQLVVTKMLKEDALDISSGRIRVKISGDGTFAGKRCHLVTFGFSIINHRDRQPPVYLLLAAQCDEKYDDIKSVLADQIASMKELRSLDIEGHELQVEYFLTADMKFLNTVTGLQAANSKYACVWCTCPSDMRHQTDQTFPARTIQGIQQCLTGPKVRSKGCIRQPLFDFIEIDHIIPDLLHLFLRITDQLLQMLFYHLRRTDNILSDRNSSYSRETHSNLAKFERFVQNSITGSFKIHILDGKLQFGSLTGQHRLKLFDLIDIQSFLADHPKQNDFLFIWNEFHSLYKLLTNAKTADESLNLAVRSKHWVEVYGKRLATTADITPYMHVLCAHVCNFIQYYGCLTPFCQQVFENSNHVFAQNFFRGSDKRKRAFEQVLNRGNRILLNSKKRMKRRYACSLCDSAAHRRPDCPKRRNIVLSFD